MSTIERLPILVLNVHTRCNCRCAMCDIWKVTEKREMPVDLVRNQIGDLQRLGVKWVVLTGGEPLMHSGLFEMCDTLRLARVRVTALTSGLLIERHAQEIARCLDDLIVSIDGPPEIHDRIRGIPGAFAQIRRGVEAVRAHRSGFRFSGRCTVQSGNHRALRETLAAVESVGLQSISYLAVDVSSRAFNRPNGPGDGAAALALTPDDLPGLECEINALIAHRTPILADSDDHLLRILSRFRAYAGLGEHEAPRCNAPWVSAVVEVDGSVRPCFFHPPVANVMTGLAAAINSPHAAAFRETLNVATDNTCRHCVCSLNHTERG